MKKIRSVLSLLLCILIALCCAAPAVSAKDDKYKLKDLKMSIRIPDTMAVKTKSNSNDLASEVYLEATSSSGELSIIISMTENETTKEVFSFKDLTADSLEEYKDEMLTNDAYTDCTTGIYGKVPFLDFSLRPTAENGTPVYCKQSVTVVNGMNIVITSRSVGDSFTSEELNLIVNCLNSIRFTRIKSIHTKAIIVKVIVWIIVILLLLTIGFIALSYYMSKRSAAQRQYERQKRRQKTDYDVLSRADESEKNRQKQQRVGGYNTSREYFDNGYDDFEPEAPAPEKLEPVFGPTATDKAVAVTEKAVRTTSDVFTHMGYFFKNLKRQTKKSPSRRTSSGRTSRGGSSARNSSPRTTSRRSPYSGKPGTSSRRTPSKNYDIFSDR